MISIKTKPTKDLEVPEVEKAEEQKVRISIKNPNQSCALMVETIFDKIIELMIKDDTITGLKKTIIVRTAEGSKEPIKKYVLALSEADAQDIIDRVKEALE
jgi:hypothetical protein